MIRKRHIITAIATLTILLLTNSFWLKFEPVTVNFKLSGSGNTVVGTKLSGLFFHSSRVYKEYNLDNNQNISIKINDAKYFNRLKLTIDNNNLSGGGA